MQKNFSVIIRAWKMLTPFHGRFYLHVFLAFLLSGISIISTYAGSRALSATAKIDIPVIILSVAAMFTIEIVWNILSYFKNNNEGRHLGQDVFQHLQEISLRQILKLTPEQHIEDHSAIKQQIIARGETSLQNIIKTFTSDFLPNISYVIVAIATLMYYSVAVGVFALLVCAILLTWILKFLVTYRPLIQRNRDNWILHSKKRTEAFTHLQLMKLLSHEDAFIKEYIDERKGYADYDTSVGVVSLNHKSKRSIFISMGENLSLLIAIVLTLKGGMDLGGIYLIWSVTSRVFWSVTGLTNSLRDLPLRIIEVEQYFGAIDLKPNFEEKGLRNIDLHQDITLENLSFKYRRSAQGVLSGISCTIPAGQITAFVGSSGSGKSTITKILLRAYDYVSGSIKIGNHELREIDAHYLREKIGYVEQHVDLLDDTILKNILLGVKESARKKATKDLEEIAHKARIDQFYHRLGEKKFDTVVGERGIKLSGGERQRIGIARAIIKDPEILIFDEATSSLDTENERFVMDAINDVSKGKTTIIVAHRLSTIRNADKIIVMDKGKVVGEGTHDELLVSSPIYKNLVEHQLS